MIELLNDALRIARIPVEGTTQVSKDYPDLAAAASVSAGGGAWTLGSYVQIVAASVIPTSMLLGVVAILRNAAVVDMRIEIATGGAGSEVVVARVRGQLYWDSTAGFQTAMWLPTVPTKLPVNSRIAVRTAALTASQTASIAVLTIPTPL